MCVKNLAKCNILNIKEFSINRRLFFVIERSEVNEVKKTREKECSICLAWFEEKEIVDGKCKGCREDIRNTPKGMTKEEKIDHITKIKQGLLENRYKKLYLSEKRKLELCSKCEWLRFIDYLNCKVYCGKPVCGKWVGG